jgi:hypothetical protein
MTDLRQAAQQALEALCSAVEPKKGKVYAREFELIDCYAMHEQAITALQAALAQPEQEPPTCAWSPEDDDTMPGTYRSGCGELWSFIDGGWQDNHVRFCHGCGGKVEAALKERING